MPIPIPIAAGLITAGGSLVGSGIGAASQGSMNKKTRKWNEKMYQQQRADALADYHLQNQYNSPREQMARLRDAGLNPHLVYGNGADAQGGIVRQTNAQDWNPRAVQFDVGGAAASGFNAYFDAKIKEAQTDNLTAQNTVLTQEGLLKAAQILNTNAQTKNLGLDADKKGIDLKYADKLAETSLQAAMANVDRMKSETAVMLRRDEREAAMNSSNLREAAARIIKMRIENAKTAQETTNLKQQLRLLQQDEKIKEFEIRLNQAGITKGDGLFWRFLGQLVNGNIGGGDGGGSGAKDKIRYQNSNLPPGR